LSLKINFVRVIDTYAAVIGRIVKLFLLTNHSKINIDYSDHIIFQTRPISIEFDK